MTLTVAAARAAQPGDVVKCHVVRGLQLHVRTQSASWMLYYRAPSGEQRRPRIGDWPSLTIEQAREAARAVLAQVAAGRDPSQERANLRAAPTVADLCAEYLSRTAGQCKPRTRQEQERMIRLHILPRLGHVRVADVDHAAAKGMHDAITRDSGPVGANRVRAMLSVLMQLAEHSELAWRQRGTNPVADVPKNRERPRKVHVEAAMFPRLFSALDSLAAEYPAHVAAIRVMMYAGTRVTELITARRRQLIGGRIVLSDHKTDRTGDERVIHLPAQALAAISALQQSAADDLLFGRMTRYDVFRIWDMARRAADCPSIRPQDVRRTFASVAVSNGMTLDQIGQLFGHRDASTTRGYAWLMGDAGDALAQSVADRIDGHASRRR